MGGVSGRGVPLEVARDRLARVIPPGDAKCRESRDLEGATAARGVDRHGQLLPVVRQAVQGSPYRPSHSCGSRVDNKASASGTLAPVSPGEVLRALELLSNCAARPTCTSA